MKQCTMNCGQATWDKRSREQMMAECDDCIEVVLQPARAATALLLEYSKAMHECDTPLCVNPDHLFLGSHQDNMRDMVAKQRSFVGRGEDKKCRAKLTNQQADQIRKMSMSHSKIGAMFGVSAATIGRIKRKESY